MMLVRLGAVLFFTPVFLLPGICIAVIGAWIGNIYIHAQLCMHLLTLSVWAQKLIPLIAIKREMSKAKAPVLGIFGGAINGLGEPHFVCFYKCYADK
jgi:hypothetical protein